MGRAKIAAEDKEPYRSPSRKNKDADNSPLLRDIYLPRHMELFDYSDADKKRYTMNLSTSMRDLYIHHTCDKAKQGKTVDYTYQEFREAMLLFNALMTKNITEEGYWYKLPYGLGSFGVSKFTPRYYKPRFQKEGVELYNNPHTAGFVAKFSHIKDKLFLANKGLFRHSSTSTMKQSIAHAIFNLNASDKYAEVSREEELLTNKNTTKLDKKINKADRVDMSIEEYVALESTRDKFKTNTALAVKKK